jgi:NhaP-type Na+/H+ or K+/H+ antiporter
MCCDPYVTLGADQIETVDVFTGFAAFIVLVLGGTTIGIVWDFLAGFTTKFTHRVPVIEPIVLFIMSYYGALINAEAFQLSGIFSYVIILSINQGHVLLDHHEELRGGKCVKMHH